MLIRSAELIVPSGEPAVYRHRQPTVIYRLIGSVRLSICPSVRPLYDCLARCKSRSLISPLMAPSCLACQSLPLSSTISSPISGVARWLASAASIYIVSVDGQHSCLRRRRRVRSLSINTRGVRVKTSPRRAPRRRCYM